MFKRRKLSSLSKLNFSLLSLRNRRKRLERNISGQLKIILTCLIFTVCFPSKNSPKTTNSNWTNFRSDPFCTSKKRKAYLWLLIQVLVKLL